MKRLGIFVCECGLNIARTVDVDSIVTEIKRVPGVVLVTKNKYLCSEPGQSVIKDTMRQANLDCIIIAACSPTLHETTFRRVVESMGINPYLCEIANIREHCSWIHHDPQQATQKALHIIKSIIAKTRLNSSLIPIQVPLIKKALIIGGGISGIQAALDIANSGYDVIIVEKDASLGGHMAQLSETFPTLDCSQCILTPKMVEVAQHPRITIHTNTTIRDISGYVGKFTVTCHKSPRYVLEDLCDGCGDCAEVCPVEVPNPWEQYLTTKKAISIPYPQAVPSVYQIDLNHCIQCFKCVDICGKRQAINFSQSETVFTEEAGAIIFATGYDLYPLTEDQEYGYGKHMDVIDGLTFERILSASGPSQGEVKRPSDNTIPKEVVFIQCVRSRNPEKGVPYCSKICCMYTAKHAMLYKHRVPDGQAYIFYMDIRAGGKGYEEFTQTAIEEYNVLYLRGRVSRVFKEGNKLMVWGEDTLTSRKIEIAADLVVLATAITPANNFQQLANKIRLNTDTYGFLKEAHPKLRPVESLTTGYFLAGCAQAPRDIAETIAQASGAASKVISLFSGEVFYKEPTTITLNPSLCSGCGTCVDTCPYQALQLNKELNQVSIIEALCEGCGDCAASCRSHALELRNCTDLQLYNMIDALTHP
jgi:heterodisulfide reductase subunit A